MAQAQEVAVETGEPARLHAGHQPHLVLEPRLVAARDVVVPHIRRVADHEVVGTSPGWGNRTGEVLLTQHQLGAFPERGCWHCVVPIDLVAGRGRDLARRKDRPQCRKESAGADRGVQEPDSTLRGAKSLRVFQDVQRKRRRRCELARCVSRRPRLPVVQSLLERQAAFFETLAGRL